MVHPTVLTAEKCSVYQTGGGSSFLTQQNTHKFQQYNKGGQLKKGSVGRCVTIHVCHRDLQQNAPECRFFFKCL